MKKALITGITGQDGSYLADLLLAKGYEVHGIIRRSSSFNTQRLDHIFDKIHLHYGDLTDTGCMLNNIKEIQPDEIYNLGAQSHVRVSFDIPEYTTDVDALGTLRILEAVRTLGITCKIYQASTSEMYGKVLETPQTELTPFYPRSPYGCAKVYGYWLVKNYREAYDMFACSGILFNHESPRRGGTFVTQKVVQGISRIAKGEQNVLRLGNLNAQRDWGHAKDYVEGMWLMLQQDKPDDYVLATGVTHTIRELVEIVARQFDMDIEWHGNGVDEVGMDKNTKKTIVCNDPRYYRPTEVELLCGDATKAQEVLGWRPTHNFKSLIKEMCDHEKGI